MSWRRAARGVLVPLWVCLFALAGCDDSGGGAAPGGDPAPADGGADIGGDDGAAADAPAAPDTPGALDASADTPAPDAAPDSGPTPPAEYGVGYTEIEVTTASGRVLPVAIWYPAAAPAPDAQPYEYLGLMARDAVADAPVASTGGPWPLLAFSHGNGGLKEQSVFLTEGLARVGYVVAAPDHVRNTIFDLEGDAIGELARERPADIRAIIDRFASPAADDPAWFGARVDLERVGMLGHSFGGYTTLAVAGATVKIDDTSRALCAATPDAWGCQIILALADVPPDGLRDERVRVAVPMAPAALGAFGADGLADMPVPTLVLAGALDETTPLASVVQPIYDGLATPKWLWVLAHGNHYHFADYCDVLAAAPPELLDAEMAAVCEPDAPLDSERAHALVFGVVRPFLDWQLKGDADAAGALEEEAAEAVDPEIEMTAAP